MVADLSEFLRYTLISKNYSGVPLIKEIKAIKSYLDIEKKRYEDKLHIEYEIDEGSEEFAIPCFLIHPLIENAVKYGMQTSKMPLKLKIKSVVLNKALTISVSNSGRWVDVQFNQPISYGTGTGLENIKKRLANAYPDSHTFNILKGDNEVTVIIELKKTESS